MFVHLSEEMLDASLKEILKAARAGQRVLLLAPEGDDAANQRGRRLRAAGFVSRRVWASGAEISIGREGAQRGWLAGGMRACGRVGDGARARCPSTSTSSERGPRWTLSTRGAKRRRTR